MPVEVTVQSFDSTMDQEEPLIASYVPRDQAMMGENIFVNTENMLMNIETRNFPTYHFKQEKVLGFRDET